MLKAWPEGRPQQTGWVYVPAPVAEAFPNAIAFTVVGDCMHPTIPEGSKVVVDPTVSNPAPGDVAWVRIEQGQECIYCFRDGRGSVQFRHPGGSKLARVLLPGDNQVVLTFDNPAYGSLTVEGGVLCLGKVVYVIGPEGELLGDPAKTPARREEHWPR